MKLISLILPALLVSIVIPAGAEEYPDQQSRLLWYRYQALMQGDGVNLDDKVLLHSSLDGKRLSSDSFSFFPYPVTMIERILKQPAQWCEFMLLNLNIKTCTYQSENQATYLTFYAGRKYYEPPEDAYELQYRFNVDVIADDYFKIRLTSEEGPYGTKDYIILVEGMQLQGKTLVRIHSAYDTSTWSRMGTQLYLSTLGANKVGFSITGYQDDAPVYVTGLRGIIERNAMRYYLALKTHLDIMHQSANDRFESRLHQWFDATETYARQLDEMDKDEYLQAKRKEYKNQQVWQARLTNND